MVPGITARNKTARFDLKKMGRCGLAHLALALSKTPNSEKRGTESGTPNTPNTPQFRKDPDLAMVVERWPNLPEHIKTAVKTLVSSNLGDTSR
jgi:hypothetical protein